MYVDTACSVTGENVGSDVGYVGLHFVQIAWVTAVDTVFNATPQKETWW
jgi:hypothetical protein